MTFGPMPSEQARTGIEKRRATTMSTPAPTPPTARRKWSDAERRRVKRMLSKGATAAVVARAMGINRNMALGRIWRDPEMALMGYSHRPKVPKPHLPSKPRPKPAIAAKVTTSEAIVVCASVPPPPSPGPDRQPKAHPMALIGTGGRWCKWPVAEQRGVLGGFLCCGCRSLHGDVYCAKHRAMSAAPPRRPT